MSDEVQESPAAAPPAVLRREALLPTERSRGFGTVAIVCTMAGVASGLALATTLMAMQVADSMSVHTSSCPSHMIDVTPVAMSDNGFLGIRYVYRHGAAEVVRVLPGTPAQSVQIHPGDRVLSVDGVPVTSDIELQQQIFAMRPGSNPLVVIDRSGVQQTLHPTLIAMPTIAY
jgi:S1-C subfamily serine protease